MRKLVVGASLTLDGAMQAPAAPPRGVAIAYGSLYEWMLRRVVGPDAAQARAWPYGQPTRVFSSRSLPAFPGPTSGSPEGTCALCMTE